MTTNTSVNESWLATSSGQVIDLLNPDPACFTIEDIANNLSKLCRFNGQLKRFYSVAQHSMYVASLVPEPLKLQALLHDATEAYICDVPTPLKAMLGSVYKDIEERIARAIGEKFAVDLVNLHPTVKAADRVMLLSERDALQECPQSWGCEMDEGLRYPGFSPVDGSITGHFAAEFRRRFEEYKTLKE